MKVDFKKIHFYRKQKKISIYELCIKINIGRTTIWKWEKKKSFPKEIHIRRIAKILNISVSEISDLQSEHPISNINLSNATPTWLEITKSSSHPSAIDFIQLNNILNRLKLKLDNSSLIIRGLMSATYSEVYVKDKNLKYVIANDEFKRTFSLVKNFDFKGKKDKDFFNKQEASKNEAEDMQVLLSGKPISNREGFMPGTRKKKWAIISKLPIFDNSNDIEGIVAVFFNITERKHNEELREQLEINLNNMSESILIYEEDTMNFLYVNKASAKMHGYTFEEFKKMDMPTRKKNIYILTIQIELTDI
ncbi:MAG: PAS domain-containing protein [bacterium]|nr:PAS domain-containing protein [bacterium]